MHTFSDKNEECRVSAAMLHCIRLKVINHSTHAKVIKHSTHANVSVHNQL